MKTFHVVGGYYLWQSGAADIKAADEADASIKFLEGVDDGTIQCKDRDGVCKDTEIVEVLEVTS